VDPGGPGAPKPRHDGRAEAASPAARGSSPSLTRRDFVRAAAFAGVALAAAGIGYWSGFLAGTPLPTPPPTQPPTTPPTPSPSQSPEPSPSPRPSQGIASESFRSRPDLSSPIVSVTSPGLNVAAGLILLTPRSGPGPLIVDNAGSPVWIRPVEGKQALNLRMATYRGVPVLSWWEGSIVRGTGQGEYVIVDRSYREVTRVRAQNGLAGDLHEFIVTPQGTALFSVYADHPLPAAYAGTLPTPPPSPTPAASDLPALYESIVQEVDIATGRLLFEWHSADHIGPDESYAIPPNDQSFDYFHLNSIDVEPDGNLLISARHTCALYRIDRTSGEVIWRLGGKRSDFAMGEGAPFAWQHDARRQPDGAITVFDDGSNGQNQPTEANSRGIVLAVDESAMTVTLTREYSRPPILAKSQGSMEPLSNGNVLVGWGDQPYYTEFYRDGGVALEARLPDGASSYRAVRFPWPGKGDGDPALAGDLLPSGSSMLYASWNGATDVTTWIVLGGDSPGALRAVTSRPRTGFETEIPVSGQPAFVAVRALNSRGRTLGQSQSLPLGPSPTPSSS
jgi:hypothetical protein